MTLGKILVIDVGTSGVRASIVDGDSNVTNNFYEKVLPSSPAPSFVEFDPVEMAQAVLRVANASLAQGGPVDCVGIANQRASTILWDRKTGVPVGPGIGWQDLRTVVTCLMMRDQGIRLAPNLSATKLSFLLDIAEKGRDGDYCFGTVDSWIAWTLSGGTLHVTDATNVAVTGLRYVGADDWDAERLEALNIPVGMLPTVVNSSQIIGEASELEGSPPIAGIAGDQQASLVGQGCTQPGMAKITFGTGGMLDACTGPAKPGFDIRGPNGTYPIVSWKRNDTINWGIEAVMLSAGTCVEWLR
ncbi:MAG TPA: FGGY family carbohydrate kinase, partial [Acidimicrobiales bacterium]|nr:FGGY family carbohydrate kinase [Acidimicrobiales bacterium]